MRRSDRLLTTLALTAALTAAASLALPSSASAYCRTSSCGDAGTGQVCTPGEAGDCGIVVSWPSPCVEYSLQKDASKKGIDLATARQVFKEAFATWTSAPCEGGTPRMKLTETEPVECHKHEYNQDQGNANIIMFRDDSWPYTGAANTLALTTVTYNLDTGEIYDADMEINSFDATFTTGDTNVEFDLLSIATHETGHFLGLAHSPNLDATMFMSYAEHDTSIRSLSDDDVNAICAVYPPGDAIPSSCDPTPRHGFSSTCAVASDDSGGCSVSGPGAVGGGLASGALAVAALGLVASRRRAQRSRLAQRRR